MQIYKRCFNRWAIGVVAISFLLQSITISAAQDTEPQNLEELKASIEAIIEEYKAPGAAIVVVKDNAVVLSEGFGYADLAEKKPMTASTLLRVGSLSKNLTSLAAMKLMDQSKLDIDLPMKQLAPDVLLNNPWEATNPITMRHLLGHTAGIEGSTYYEYSNKEPNISPRDYAKQISPKVKVRWRPGEYYTYANPGHTLAAVAIEDSCECSFDDYLEREIFAKLGMNNTTFRLTPALQSQLSSSYTKGGASEQAEWIMAIRPSGSLLSTADDLAKLIQFYAAPRNGQRRLVSDKSLNEMEQVQDSSTGRMGMNISGYGIGTFAFSPGNGRILYGHSGSTEGFKTWLGYSPGKGAGFALVINAADSGLRWRLTQLLGEYVSRDSPPAEKAPIVALDSSAAKQLTGWYAPFTHDMTLRAGMIHILQAVKVSLVGDELIIDPLAPNLSATTLLPETQRLFRQGDYPRPTTAFVDDPDGRIILVNGESFEPISGFRAVGRFVLFFLTFLVAAIAVLVGLVRAALWLKSRSATASSKPARWLIASSVCWLLLFALFFAKAIFGTTADILSVGRVSGASLSLLAISVVGPIATLVALLTLFRSSLEGRWFKYWAWPSALVLLGGWLLLALNGWFPLVTFLA